MKKLIALLLALVMVLGLVACGAKAPAEAPKADEPKAEAPKAEEPKAEEPKVEENLTATQKIIKEAETMTLEELAKKAIEESNGAMFYGLGNSSRGKTALPLFIAYLQTIDPNYKMDFEWQQPKNNKIFDQLTADSLKETGTFAMTLIQDGNQIQSKMVDTGVLKTFIPKDWAEANGTTADKYEGYLALQTLNKIFEYKQLEEVAKPYFADGMNIAQYFASHMQFPAEAKEREIQGTVRLSFVVEKDGSVSNIVIVNSVGGGCDNEAVRLIQETHWLPAEKGGKYVRSRNMQDITFSIGSRNFQDGNSY